MFASLYELTGWKIAALSNPLSFFLLHNLCKKRYSWGIGVMGEWSFFERISHFHLTKFLGKKKEDIEVGNGLMLKLAVKGVKEAAVISLFCHPRRTEKDVVCLNKFCVNLLKKNPNMDKYYASTIYLMLGFSIEGKFDFSSGLKYIEKAAEMGQPHAIDRLATIFSVRIDPRIAIDIPRAKKLCEELVGMNYWRIATTYRLLEKNQKKSSKFFELSLKNGCPQTHNFVHEPIKMKVKDLHKHMKDMAEKGFKECLNGVLMDFVSIRRSLVPFICHFEELNKKVPSGQLAFAIASEIIGHDFEKGWKYLMQSCELQYPYSFVLAAQICHREGKYDQAIEFYEKGVSIGDRDACTKLFMELHHKKDSESRKKMLKSLEMGAQLLDFECACKIGFIYMKGELVEKDWKKAMEYLRLCYSIGDVRAADLIGEMYLEGGEGVEKNEKKAKEIFEWAARKGSEASKQFLEKMKNKK